MVTIVYIVSQRDINKDLELVYTSNSDLVEIQHRHIASNTNCHYNPKGDLVCVSENTQH